MSPFSHLLLHRLLLVLSSSGPALSGPAPIKQRPALQAPQGRRLRPHLLCLCFPCSQPLDLLCRRHLPSGQPPELLCRSSLPRGWPPEMACYGLLCRRHLGRPLFSLRLFFLGTWPVPGLFLVCPRTPAPRILGFELCSWTPATFVLNSLLKKKINAVYYLITCLRK